MYTIVTYQESKKHRGKRSLHEYIIGIAGLSLSLSLFHHFSLQSNPVLLFPSQFSGHPPLSPSHVRPSACGKRKRETGCVEPLIHCRCGQSPERQGITLYPFTFFHTLPLIIVITIIDKVFMDQLNPLTSTSRVLLLLLPNWPLPHFLKFFIDTSELVMVEFSANSVRCSGIRRRRWHRMASISTAFLSSVLLLILGNKNYRLYVQVSFMCNLPLFLCSISSVHSSPLCLFLYFIERDQPLIPFERLP